MLMADRNRRIVELVEREGSVRVSELSELFQVTEET
ncbi:MAG: DeoR family transcriptional regulator, partial [Alicyclobacillus shizuokensis]|nr:DeoR family transcriptional regulator [Alicyclobacillus shizuokensis]